MRHTVESYDDCKPVFDGHEANRRLHGATGHRVLHDVMSKAGVTGAPEIAFLEPVEQLS